MWCISFCKLHYTDYCIITQYYYIVNLKLWVIILTRIARREFHNAKRDQTLHVMIIHWLALWHQLAN